MTNESRLERMRASSFNTITFVGGLFAFKFGRIGENGLLIFDSENNALPCLEWLDLV